MSQTTGESAHEELSISYVGPALDSHSMDVRQLAPSLLALADLFTIAHNSVGQPLALPPALEVHAQRGGSFIVDLWLSMQESSGTLVEALNGRHATAAGTALGLGSPVIGALIWTRNRLRKGREKTVAEIEPGRIRITWADGTHVEAPVEAQNLVASMDFTRAAARVFEPLRREGIDEVELRQRGSGRGGSVKVVRDDLPAFNTLDDDEKLLSDNTRVVVIRVENLAFKPGNKWRVNDGSASIWVTVDDLQFLQRMGERTESFADGDSFVVRMRDRQFQSLANGIRVEHSIEEVIEHRSAPPPPDELTYPDE
jgi:hypothetical protein